MKLADRLKATRELGDLPAYELSELAGFSGGYVAHIERGRTKNPGFDAIAKLARVLGVSVDYLASGTEPEPTKEQVTAAVAAARAAKAPAVEAAPDSQAVAKPSGTAA